MALSPCGLGLVRAQVRVPRLEAAGLQVGAVMGHAVASLGGEGREWDLEGSEEGKWERSCWLLWATEPM